MKLPQGRVKLKMSCGLNTRGVVISFDLRTLTSVLFIYLINLFIVQTTILTVYITIFTVYLQIISIEYLYDLLYLTKVHNTAWDIS